MAVKQQPLAGRTGARPAGRDRFVGYRAQRLLLRAFG